MERVYQNPKSKIRLERMLKSITYENIEVLTDKSLNKLVKKCKWQAQGNIRTGSFNRKATPTLIFNEFRWNKSEIIKLTLRYPRLRRGLFLGQNPSTKRDKINIHGGVDKCVCQEAIEIHSLFGCLHACDYCHIETYMNIMLNLEELVEHIKQIMIEYPAQQLYKYDNYSDQIPFEPEYGASVLLVPFFAQQKDKYLLLYTKSANVDHLLSLDHKGHTIINWSLSPDTQSRFIEKETPQMLERIEAIKKCQDAGDHVRVRLSPIVPVKNWKDEVNVMVAKLFEAAPKLDLITMDIIGFMTPSVMKQALDIGLFEEKAVKILNELENSKKKKWGKMVFPRDYRQEMYRYIIAEIRKVDPKVPISICNETFEMWEEMDDVLGGMTPDDFVCCCGPNSVPGSKWL